MCTKRLSKDKTKARRETDNPKLQYLCKRLNYSSWKSPWKCETIIIRDTSASCHLLPRCLRTAPPYLSELLHLYSPSRSPRSASYTRIFRVPRMDRRTLEERTIQYIGLVIWNSLPVCVRHSSSLSSFRSKPKPHLFSSACWSIVFFLIILPTHHQ